MDMMTKGLFGLGFTLLLCGALLVPSSNAYADDDWIPVPAKVCKSGCSNGNNPSGCNQYCGDIDNSDPCQKTSDQTNCKDCECYNKGTDGQVVCGCRVKT